MARNYSTSKTPGSAARRFVSVLLVCVLLAGAAAIAFVWTMIQPRHIVTGTVRIAPIVRDILTNEPQPDETADYVQFVNTQAVLLMSEEQTLQRIADDLIGRNLAFFSGKPCTRMEKFLSRIHLHNASAMPDQILREAISCGDISAGYVPDSELMHVTMISPNIDEARIVVNSFLRNYVAQYGVNATTSESQNMVILENQRNEIEKRIADGRNRIRDLAREYGTTALDPRRELQMKRDAILQEDLAKLEAERIKIEADIRIYEGTEKLEMAPSEIVRARTTHTNDDPMIKELTARIVQAELDQVVDGQAQSTDETRQGTVLKALQQKFEERRRSLAEEFDRELESNLREAAQQRVIQARAEKVRIEGQIEGIRQVLGDQEARTVVVGNTNLDIQDLQRKLTMDEEVLDQVNRRLRWLEVARDRRPRVCIASPAEAKSVVDPRWRWTLIVLGTTVVLSVILGAIRRANRPRPVPEEI